MSWKPVFKAKGAKRWRRNSQYRFDDEDAELYGLWLFSYCSDVVLIETRDEVNYYASETWPSSARDVVSLRIAGREFYFVRIKQ